MILKQRKLTAIIEILAFGILFFQVEMLSPSEKMTKLRTKNGALANSRNLHKTMAMLKNYYLQPI